MSETNRSDMRVIGGSNIAALIGLSRWQSPYSLYLHLTGQLPPQQDNEVLTRGRRLEPVVASLFESNHEEFVVEEHPPVVHPQYEYLIGSPDRVLRQSSALVAGLEIKTASSFDEWGDEQTDKIPPEYACQSAWYCGLMNVPIWHIAVMFVHAGSRKFRGYKEYAIHHNQELFENMVHLAVAFWNEHVIPQVPPPITAPDNDTIRYFKERSRIKDKAVYADASIIAEVNDLREAQEKLKEAEKEFELKKVRILDKLGDSELLLDDNDQKLISYKGFETSTFDYKTMISDLAISSNVLDKYKKTTQGRRFCVLAKKPDTAG